MKQKGGKREGAGRKGFYDELMVKKIIDKSNEHIFNALCLKGRYANLEPEIVLELSRHFGLKAIPTNVDLNSTERKELEVSLQLDGLTVDELRGLIAASRTRALPAGTA